MESISGELTLYDLLAWEPRLTVVSSTASDALHHDLLAREVDWILTARSTPPLLPTLRGGEVIILPDRIVSETGVPFDRLIGEVRAQSIAGVITDAPLTSAVHGDTIVMRTRLIDADTEGNLNRLLTSGRRNALETAADIEHEIVELLGRSARPGEIIDHLANHLRLPITVASTRGVVMFTTASSRDIPDANSPAWVSRPLRNEHIIWIGPIPPERHALARFAIGRIRDGIQRSLDASATTAPRGNARTIALNSLLQTGPDVPTETVLQRALDAGLPPGRPVRVALTPMSTADSVIRRVVQPMGDILDAGVLDDLHAMLIVQRDGTPPGSAPSPARNLTWATISAPIESATDMVEAVRQARFLSLLIGRELLEPGIIRFEDDHALGAFRLLFDMWETPLLDRYRHQHLADLIANDARGQLVETLRVYLEHGGSQRLTAEALGIHRNTLGYRLRQIRAILPNDIDAPLTRLTLHLALVASQLDTPTPRS